MRSLGSLLLLLPVGLLANDSWPQILSSIGVIPGDSHVVVTGPGANADSAFRQKVESGTYLILEGESPLAATFGFRAVGARQNLAAMIDIHQPKLPLILDKPFTIQQFTVPPGAKVFTKDRWSDTPTVAGMKVGSGGVLWLAFEPGVNGYERFPYLPQALASLGWESTVRASRTWAFFDDAYRTRVDLDYFAKRWHKAGISALHVAAWHFYDDEPERDAYLKRLVEACHREGILVYAWLELPHVSEKFWNDHPRWREKTAVLQDAALDWRRLMNLVDPDCAREVKRGLANLIGRFDWDGINVAELYYESLEGAANPSRFTPMNDEVRSRFRAGSGFDPVELWTSRKDARSLRAFLDFRASLARHLQEDWLSEMEKLRSSHPGLDIVLTHVDDRMDKGMSDAIGADSSRAFALLKDHSFTFMVEDPATLWNQGPSRYREIAKSYPASPKLAIDINVVDRYQDVYPTKQQTGIELFQLIHVAAESFPRVALYFENSILPPDWPLLSAASAVVTKFERSDTGIAVDSPYGFITRWEGPALVDGVKWAALDGQQVLLPAGKHTVVRSVQNAGPHLVAFNGDLISAISPAQKQLTIDYKSSSRALATIDCPAESMRADGLAMPVKQVGSTVFLPAGAHRVEVICR